MGIVTYEKYRQMARALVQQFGFTVPPIDVYKIAAGLGIEVIELTLPNWFFGVLMNVNSDFYIAVNKGMSQQSKRFTIAHELAHFQLHGQQLAYMKNSKRDYYHREADVFAAELCMPSNMVKQEALKWCNDYKYLAQLFQVSQIAMVRKMQELRLLRASVNLAWEDSK